MRLINFLSPARCFGGILVTGCLLLILLLAADGNASGGHIREIALPGSISESSAERFVGGEGPGGEHFERFGDFTIPLKDAAGGDRILVCTMIVALHRGMDLPEERTGLRTVIYRVLRERSGAAEMEKGLRKDIKERLNIALRGDKVQDIYFTRFVLL